MTDMSASLTRRRDYTGHTETSRSRLRRHDKSLYGEYKVTYFRNRIRSASVQTGFAQIMSRSATSASLEQHLLGHALHSAAFCKASRRFEAMILFGVTRVPLSPLSDAQTPLGSKFLNDVRTGQATRGCGTVSPGRGRSSRLRTLGSKDFVGAGTSDELRRMLYGLK